MSTQPPDKSQTTNDPRAEAHACLTNAIESRTAVCAVVGLGFVGSATMEAIMEAGFEVHGYDRAPECVSRFEASHQGKNSERPWSVSINESVLASADIVLLATRVLPRPDSSLNLEPLEACAQSLRSYPRKQQLILLQSTVAPGITREFTQQWLKISNNSGVLVAHCPERLQSDNSVWTFRNTPRVVGGMDTAATLTAESFLRTMCDEVMPVSAPEISEISKLLENCFMSVGISLIAEITRLAHTHGVAASEVTRAASTKPYGYYAFHPGPGIGGHCIPNDLKILRNAMHSSGISSALLDGACEESTRLPVDTVGYLEQLAPSRGTGLKGLEVLVVGMGFKIGSPDTTLTPARDIVRELRKRGAVPVYLDSQVPHFDVDGQAVIRLEADQLPGKAFVAGVVLAGDPALSGEQLQASVEVLLDTGGGRAVSGGLPGAYRL